MRLFTRVLIGFVLAGGSLWSAAQADSPNTIEIHRLTIESNSLPERDRRQIVRQFEGSSYEGASQAIAEEFGQRVRMALRDRGYFEAGVDDPEMSFTAADHGRRIADVRIKVKEGAQYRLGKIKFVNAKLFPADQLRGAFDLQDGDLFNATKFGRGLENMTNLYATEGYANFTAIPQPIKDDSRHVIDETVDVNEGSPYDFGRLILEGPEPHAGAGKALLDSWTSLQGKRYNPAILQQWLAANRSNWEDGSHTSDPITFRTDGESKVVNIKLSFPEGSTLMR